MQPISLLLTLGSFAFTTIATPINGIIVYRADDNATFPDLETRNAYALGVNIFSAKGCQGDIVATRNHDKNSCQYPSTTSANSPQWLSAKVKPDGADNGEGCMTTFSDSACTTGSQYYSLDPNACIDFDYAARCVVVAEHGSGGSCTINTPTC